MKKVFRRVTRAVQGGRKGEAKGGAEWLHAGLVGQARGFASNCQAALEVLCVTPRSAELIGTITVSGPEPAACLTLPQTAAAIEALQPALPPLNGGPPVRAALVFNKRASPGPITSGIVSSGNASCMASRAPWASGSAARTLLRLAAMTSRPRGPVAIRGRGSKQKLSPPQS
jgi:hypothetical protein